MSSTETGSNKKTAQYCATLAKDAIKEANLKYGCHVSAVTTDNEKKLQKMRDLLPEDDQNVIVYGCASHWLNLLGQDITPSQVVNNIVEIKKYFRTTMQLEIC